MKTDYTLFTKANCLGPARAVELAPENILTNDVVLPWESHCHNMRGWIVGHAHGAIALVWASHEQDALDTLCDENKMECFMVEDQLQDNEDDELAHLGNAGELHDLSDCWLAEVEWNVGRDVLLLCKLAEARGAAVDNLDKI